jgi:predicted transcriptional regulator
MVTQELAQAIIHERRLEVDRLQLEHQPQPDGSATKTEVRFLTSAARVLAAVVQEPGATMRDLARRCDKTERAVWQHLQELERAGLLRHQRRGRRNRYEVDSSAVERQLMLESAPLLAVAAGPGTN